MLLTQIVQKQEPIYDSAFIQRWIVQKYADKEPKLLTGDLDLDLKADQILTLSEGLLDAYVLAAFESKRDQSKQSSEWLARQQRKIDGGLQAFEKLVEAAGPSKYLLGDTYTIADIAVACGVAQIEFSKFREGWREKYPKLAKWYEVMEARPHYKETYPVMFDLKDSVVS